jgi:group I intron endonuclease
MIYTVYQYQHRESGKKYIGVTNDPARRYRMHAKGTSGARAFTNAVKKYGIDAFVLTEISHHRRWDIAARAEQDSILKLSLSPKGYNCIAGAPFTQYHGPHSNDTKAKISAANVGKVKSFETRSRISESKKGQPSTFLGHHHSLESKAKNSMAHMGKKASSETRAKMLGRPSPFRGHHHSDKTKKILAEVHTGLHHSIETRNRMSANLIGNTRCLGYHHTDETRAKMSVSQKRRANEQKRKGEK